MSRCFLHLHDIQSKSNFDYYSVSSFDKILLYLPHFIMLDRINFLNKVYAYHVFSKESFSGVLTLRRKSHPSRGKGVVFSAKTVFLQQFDDC